MSRLLLAILALVLVSAGSATLQARVLTPVDYARLPGWTADAHGEAFATFRRSCTEIVAAGRGFRSSSHLSGDRGHWLPICQQALAQPERIPDGAARSFFERHFSPYQVIAPKGGEGLFTGYFEPEFEGSLQPGGPYAVPLYARPADLVDFDAATAKRLGVPSGRVVAGKPQPYWTRREIEQGALRGRGLELVWLKHWEDAFFLQIQGSGRIRLPDGRTIRVGYAAKTGRPYTPIGRILVERGELARDQVSMQTIRAWLARHPEQARSLMWENESFVFFRRVDAGRPDLGPVGAQDVQLTPGRSLAVDRSLYAYGTPVWLDTAVPSLRSGGLEPMRRLLIAQDTGTAIKGHVRGDVFWGAGEQAAHIAGLMRSPGRMFILLPRTMAASLKR